VNPELVAASDAVPALAGFDALIDARSPAEFAEDHLPGALNWPVLDDDERRLVGTLYKRQGPLAARKLGAPLVARRIAAHFERELADKPRGWRPLVYCWRGGQRSGSLAWLLAQVGFRTTQLAGGYKAFRAVVRQELQTLPLRHRYTVIAGRTGSGKTRLLQALAAAGAQVLDLEDLACHRGSVLGGRPDAPQPTQKRFDTLVWQALNGFDAARPVFVESESARIGRLRVPETLLVQMREQGDCVRVEMDDAARVQLLLEEYGFFAEAPERFCALLAPLTALRGRETVARWQSLARAGDWPALFAALMAEHYDPLYEQSMRRSYRELDSARRLVLADGGPAAMAGAARALWP
jgi:tRNA 2-selenouridine synthase